MRICEYGCGQKATHQFKNGKWCCEKITTKCPGLSKNHSNRMKGKNNPMYGKTHSDETKLNQSNKMKDHIPWNKGKTDIYSDETKKKMRISAMNRTMSDETKNKISKKLKGNPSNKKGISLSQKTKNKMSKNSTITNKLFHWTTKFTFFTEIEQLRQNGNKIEAKCKNCNKWFKPTYTQLYSRATQLESLKGNDGSYLYCSDECKQECPLYHKKGINPNKENELNYTPAEYQTFRNEVLNREDYKCEYCGEKAIHVHHSRPQKLEPFFSLDPDFGIACCEKCHYEKGHKDECSTGKIANKVCI